MFDADSTRVRGQRGAVDAAGRGSRLAALGGDLEQGFRHAAGKEGVGIRDRLAHGISATLRLWVGLSSLEEDGDALAAGDASYRFSEQAGDRDDLYLG